MSRLTGLPILPQYVQQGGRLQPCTGMCTAVCEVFVIAAWPCRAAARYPTHIQPAPGPEDPPGDDQHALADGYCAQDGAEEVDVGQDDDARLAAHNVAGGLHDGLGQRLGEGLHEHLGPEEEYSVGSEAHKRVRKRLSLPVPKSKQAPASNTVSTAQSTG